MPELGDFKKYSGVFLTTVFLFLMLYVIDLETSINALIAADPLFLFLALISANIPLLIYASVWHRVLGVTGLKLNYLTTLRLVLANTFVNNITPFGNIGGEAAATYMLSRITDQSYGKSFTPVFTSSMINFSPLVTFLIFGGIYTGYYHVLFLPVAFFSTYLIFTRKAISLKTPEFIEEFKTDFLESMSLINNSDQKLWPLMFFTHFAVVFDILSIILIGQSLGLNFYSLSIFFVVPLARVANYVPTPGGTGPYELALSGLLSFFFSVTFSQAVLVAVIYRVLTYYVGIFLGYFSINSFQIGKSYLTE